MTDSTPRLRSGWPSPQSHAKRASQHGMPAGSPKTGASLPEMPPIQSDSGPCIPVQLLDAPTQRLLAASAYGVLIAARLWDFYTLAIDDTESFWLFLKWVAVDAVFLFGMPALRIPWLEWPSWVIFTLFSLHAVLNAMLMFRVGLPLTAWLTFLLKLIYNRELALSERSVNPYDVVHNASLILGKQIIHILPEGSASLNPEKRPFCLGEDRAQIHIPIQINQTSPVRIELLRFDLDSFQNDTIVLNQNTIRRLQKDATKAQKNVNPADAVVLKYPVKKTGVYILHKVMDETNLEVQTRHSNMIVVSCPRAWVKPPGANRCRGELSDVAIQVEGTPPLKIQYRRMANDEPQDISLQSIQPEDLVSPLGNRNTGNMVIRGDQIDTTWARSRSMTVSVNETLSKSGEWTYSIQKVEDALHNIITYPSTAAESSKSRSKSSDLQQWFTVHERPKLALRDCTSEMPLRVPKGSDKALPLKFSSTGRSEIPDSAHTIEYWFSDESQLASNKKASSDAHLFKAIMKSTRDIPPFVRQPGLYSLKSVATEYCEGEVLEPSSCLLQNPTEPDLALSTEKIYDKCAGNPIGLRVGFDLIGSPPFTIWYTERLNNERSKAQSRKQQEVIQGHRGHVTLIPKQAGHYTYTFDDISDAVYRDQSLRHKNLVVEQDVKPSASAHFVNPAAVNMGETCIDEPVSFDVRLQGEGPWTLEYELVNGKKRTKKEVKDIQDDKYTITTERLKSGGEYSLLLTSVTDHMGCKEHLQQTAKIRVRNERPKAYFGTIEGRQKIKLLEDKEERLPLRLTGRPPWRLQYRNTDRPTEIVETRLQKSNDELRITRQGTYELLDVHDDVCPGSIDDSGRKFEVEWIRRPRITVPETSTVTLDGAKYIKKDVCEGDEDSFEVVLSGTPPYRIAYNVLINPDQGQRHKKDEQLVVALGITSIGLVTLQPGLYSYVFSGLSDSNYNHDTRSHVVSTLQQRVNPRPDAKFTHPGKSYSYCSRESKNDEDEIIPITLTGMPPFHLEVEIRHHTSRTFKPEVLSIPNIPSNKHNLRIPRRLLHHGNSAVSILKVSDARGCQRRPEAASSPRVQVSVHDPPTVAPLDSRADFCVGDRLAYTLGGAVPFTVTYTFDGATRRAASQGTTFRRLAEKPGIFAITAVSDSASRCLFMPDLPPSTPSSPEHDAPNLPGAPLTATIHPMPNVRISHGRTSTIDIHEGGEAEILFEFGGTPPFEVTYTRSENAAGPGRRPGRVLETRVERSAKHALRVRASEEGTYEVVAIKDRWCAFPRPGDKEDGGAGVGAQGAIAGGKEQRVLGY